MLAVDNLTQVTWHCVHFVSPGEDVALKAALAGSGLTVFEMHGAAIKTDEELFAAIAAEMRFPGYFGRNWDALDECLRDLAWLPSKGYILCVHDAAQLWQRAHRIAGALIESWLFAAEEWSSHGTPFHLIFLW